MHPVTLAAGVVLLIAGAAILKFNRRVGAAFAASNRAAHDPRYSLLNRERAERIQEAESHAGDNRLSAIGLGAMLTVMGVLVCAQGLGLTDG